MLISTVVIILIMFKINVAVINHSINMIISSVNVIIIIFLIIIVIIIVITIIFIIKPNMSSPT